MVLIINKGATKKELLAIENKLTASEPGFNPDKYNGAIKLKKDALLIQMELRNEWERTINRH